LSRRFRNDKTLAVTVPVYQTSSKEKENTDVGLSSQQIGRIRIYTMTETLNPISCMLDVT
jgi:hypothetical protein